jgi:adenylyltransferase/sulfurtransferase
MKEINPTELKAWIDNDKDFQLIDVREPYEYQIANLNGKLIPLQYIPEKIGDIQNDKDVVIMCRSGKRSADAIKYLEQQGFENLYNLKGGILAYSDDIDPSIAKY